MNNYERTISQIGDRLEELSDTINAVGIHIKRTDGEKIVYAVCDAGEELYKTPALERAATFARYLKGGTIDASEWQAVKADIIGQRLKENRSH